MPPVTDSMDQDLINTMTAEELAAINDPEADASALAAIAAGAGDGDDDPEGDDDDGPADPALADAAPAPAPAAAAPAAAAPAEPPAAAAPAPAPAADGAALDAAAAPAPAGQPVPEVGVDAPAPVYEFKLPDDFTQRQEALKTATAELRERRKQGDVSNEEYDAEHDRLADEQRELDRLQVRADLSADMVRQHTLTQRTAVANKVMDAAKAAGLDYQADDEKFAELRATIDALGRIESHRAKGFEHVIREADRRVRLAHGIGNAPAPAPTPAAAPTAPAPAKTPAQLKADANKARAPDLSAAPTTLAQIPGGDGPGDVGGEFDDVMGLEGEAYEDAIAQLAKNPVRFARFQAAKH